MKINIPRVVRPVALSEYAPEFGDQAIQMWVNPPRKVRLEFADIMDRYREVLSMIEEAESDDPNLENLAEGIVIIAGELHGWYAQMWSQGEDEWAAEDVKAFIEAALDTDPGLWDFVQEGCLDAMAAYRRQKKASSPGPPKSP